MNKNKLLNVFGIIFLVWGILAITNAIISKNYSQLFWMCYLGLFIMGFAIIKRNGFWLAVQLNILAIPSILWGLDFLSYLTFNKFLIGISAPFFNNPTILQQIVSLEHLMIVPIGFLSLYLIKVKKTNMWIISILEMLIMFPITWIFTNHSENINCAFYSCLPFDFGIYPLSWFVLLFFSTIVTNYLIINLKIFRK